MTRITALRICLLAGSLFLAGCHSLLNRYYADTLPQQSGVLTFPGLSAPVDVRYNAAGIPLIQAQNTEDAYRVWGYVHAADRMGQMELMRLTAEGRLSEYLGESALGIDSFMRKMRFRQSAEILSCTLTPQNRRYLNAYADGVNQWITTHRDTLPMDLAAADYVVPPWQADDAILIFSLANFGLAGNLHEEIDSLIVAQHLGAEKTAWLFPVSPDEPLPHAEARKFAQLNLTPAHSDTAQLKLVSRALDTLHLHDVMASNNWAVTPDLTRDGGTLLANDTHLPIGLPSLWSIIQIETPDLTLAGAAIPGIPVVVLGATPDIAWGYTMVMADNQDLFLEQLRPDGDALTYRYQDAWQPVKTSAEVFHVRGMPDVTETFYDTRHGVLLNESLKSRSYLLQPLEIELPYGIALSTLPPRADDNSINALMAIPYQKQVPAAMALARQIEIISVNMLLADKTQIGWQLTGSYPLRRQGTGLFPSPGWNGEYDWTGRVAASRYPSDLKTRHGWLASANNRVTDPGYPVNFSQTWAHPERIERINTLLAATKQHSLTTMQQMQYDQYDPMAAKFQPYLADPSLSAAIDRLPEPEQQQARIALTRLRAFDGNMHPESAGAALWSLFLESFDHQLFSEPFRDNPQARLAFAESSKSYSAQADHLLYQPDQGPDASPFWQRMPPARSGKAAVVADALAMAQQRGEQLLGTDYAAWQWGKIHRYKWNSLSAQIAGYLPDKQRRKIERLDSYLNRGPYPAGGNLNTINIASYHPDSGFNALLIPSLRLIVDYSQADPVRVMNNAGQSANPAGPHYADNIDDWLNGRYQTLPFSKAGQAVHYPAAPLRFLPDHADVQK